MPASVSTLLRPVARDIGGLLVQRLLPSHPIRMVGPFIFFDHFGPVQFPPGRGIDVRPHPHIGLATVTYLFDGGQVHRDSLGNVQPIAPGDVNWMTAGRGIVHSERPDDRAAGHLLHGLQTWVALPKSHEEVEPSFSHHPRESLPEIAQPGAAMRLLAGTAFGRRAPTPTFSPMIYLAIDMEAGAAVDLPPEHEERGVYVVDGEALIDGEAVPAGRMALLAPWTTARVETPAATRLIVLGGAKIDGERIIWWNFVASSKALIDTASERWRAQAYPPVPGETEFIPLP
jgi:redox-sensitive bicupin YhaK (pirin superfamily)